MPVRRQRYFIDVAHLAQLGEQRLDARIGGAVRIGHRHRGEHGSQERQQETGGFEHDSAFRRHGKAAR